ncbi:MAG: sigma 54-interacting transcriptional regulator [Planctomycetota bacterium]|jgi:transcriptional regulator with PAS, ATPase and Fis domain
MKRRESVETVLLRQAAGTGNEGTFIGRHPLVLDLLDRVERLARGTQPMLFQGESGTGKEILARMVHERSPRSTGPYVAVNCAAIPLSLLEGELFGAARGAYTGADGERAGLVEAAHGGTLFLDEIGDMPPAAQAALLRVLDGGRIRRLGETRERRADVRIVAATHRDLSQLVAVGGFRADLLFRLGLPVRVPPLRERRSDLPLLVRAFLEEGAEGGVPKTLARGTMARLFVHAFPGNVRELRTRMLTAIQLTEAGCIDAHHLGLAKMPVAGPAAARPLARRVCETASWRGSVSVSEVQRECEIPRRTAQRTLARLVRRGVLERTGRGPATRYRPTPTDANRGGDERRR